MNNSSEEINRIFTVPVPVNQAFKVFTEKFNVWWPKEYSWAGDALERITIEARENGRCFERGPHGFECDWGRVLSCSPPHRIVFTWQIDVNRVPQPNPVKASKIEVLFEEQEEEETRVIFKHRDLQNHGEKAEAYREALNSPQGWPYILNCFKQSFE